MLYEDNKGGENDVCLPELPGVQQDKSLCHLRLKENQSSSNSEHNKKLTLHKNRKIIIFKKD